MKVAQWCDSLRPHGLYSPWNSLGQNTGMGSLSLLQVIFNTQESNWGLLHCRQILYQLSYQGSPDRDKDLTWMWGGFITSCKFFDTSPTEKQGLYLLPLNLGDFEPWSPAEVMILDSQSWSWKARSRQRSAFFATTCGLEPWAPVRSPGTFLIFQGLRLLAPDTEGLGLILGQGTRSHMLQLRPRVVKLIN